MTAAGAEATVVGARRPEGLTAEVLRRCRRPPFSPDTTLLRRAGAAAGTVSVAPTSESDSPVVDTVDAEVDRLLALGATRVDWRFYPAPGERHPAEPAYVVLADPEGNRFCVSA